jgi:hypothetical protein
MVIRVCVDCFNLVGFVLLDQNKAWMICKRYLTLGSIKEAAQELPVIIMNRLGKGMFLIRVLTGLGSLLQVIYETLPKELNFFLPSFCSSFNLLVAL